MNNSTPESPNRQGRASGSFERGRGKFDAPAWLVVVVIGATCFLATLVFVVIHNGDTEALNSLIRTTQGR
ncbi:hypothetical protein NY057_00720 [Curtobacterium flaccumfaciens]|jgi:hypothetical protein|uniref:hypothetical protein n=1 Tax=Curtobacterium flaccumfaciens TaxID=2035 RepID=UPI00188CCE5F|nr:hypothetical protein [Curtobacterium flaccumfaciens]MBF4595802.1 hypothetical protein [Curtobacterium flaccumfaciens]UWD82787.1 hypothetical protein NY057_00720 [Curtobacterium flaccumfaciens]